MLKSSSGQRGRPRGSKKVKKEEVKALTEAERFQLMQAEVLKQLRNKDLDPKPLKDIIIQRMDNFNIRSEKRGAQLWARTLIQRGQYREEEKETAEITEFGGIRCYKLQDGLQFELPLGLSLRPRKTKQALEMEFELNKAKYLAQIMM